MANQDQDSTVHGKDLLQRGLDYFFNTVGEAIHVAAKSKENTETSDSKTQDGKKAEENRPKVVETSGQEVPETADSKTQDDKKVETSGQEGPQNSAA
jgi:hypothetical protein